MSAFRLYVLLHNLRSAYNVGSIFRTCDATGVDRLFLTGYTPTPLEPKLEKTALGAVSSVAWEHHCDPLQLVKHLQNQGIVIWALEPLPKASSIFTLSLPAQTCLILGNEVEGIPPDLIQVSDGIVKIPQFGRKESLNVASAAAVAIYECRRQLLYHKV